MADELAKLQALARAHGVLPTYVDVANQRQTASVEALRAVLGVIGVEVDGSTNLEQARLDRRRAVWRRVVEPVCVLDEDESRQVLPLRFPAKAAGTMRVTITHEDGSVHTSTADVESLPAVARRAVGTETFLLRHFVLGEPLPPGYHRLRIALGGVSHESLLICAPRRLWSPTTAATKTEWGVFLPTYAAHDAESWGCGDFTSLGRLLDWTGEAGGRFVGTLPLLASEWEFGVDPSPYAPTSRRFWNELYLDPRRCPEFERCETAKALVESAEFQADLAAARASELVDYERVVRMKRLVVEELAKEFFASDDDRRRQLDEWLLKHPEVASFARFRATGEAEEGRWPTWEAGSFDSVETIDVDVPAYRYHVYAQWQTQLQLASLGDTDGAELYLDLPLGVRRDGYDVWCDPDAFALKASGGAPPDSFFTKGQNWGFPPLHHERIRDVGYRPWIEGVRAHLSFARLLRIDHAMGLHRLYWIPDGAAAGDGVYVRYRTDEMFAILALESHRHEAILVGENLGTCPPAVDVAMEAAAMSGMYVFEFEIDAESEQTLHTVPEDALASLNTHDLPTFSTFWNALDIDDHVDLGLVDEAEADAARKGRAAMRKAVVNFLVREGALTEPTDDEQAVFLACTAWLAEQNPRYVIANLEDAWAETRPQNTPGTWLERPNWQRKSRLSLEEIAADERVRAMIETLAAAARGDGV